MDTRNYCDIRLRYYLLTLADVRLVLHFPVHLIEQTDFITLQLPF